MSEALQHHSEEGAELPGDLCTAIAAKQEQLYSAIVRFHSEDLKRLEPNIVTVETMLETLEPSSNGYVNIDKQLLELQVCVCVCVCVCTVVLPPSLPLSLPLSLSLPLHTQHCQEQLCSYEEQLRQLLECPQPMEIPFASLEREMEEDS